MGSVNRKPNLRATLVASAMVDAYLEGKSIPQISSDFGVPRSTVRARLLGAGVQMRSAVAGATKARREGRGISPVAGKYTRTPEILAKLSASKIANANATATGVSRKPSGYLEVTRGADKGRGAHIVAMEKAVGFRIPSGFIVHHVDETRDNNDIDNLALMTRAAHARLHALENLPNRKRDALGRLA